MGQRFRQPQFHLRASQCRHKVSHRFDRNRRDRLPRYEHPGVIKGKEALVRHLVAIDGCRTHPLQPCVLHECQDSGRGCSEPPLHVSAGCLRQWPNKGCEGSRAGSNTSAHASRRWPRRAVPHRCGGRAFAARMPRFRVPRRSGKGSLRHRLGQFLDHHREFSGPRIRYSVRHAWYFHEVCSRLPGEHPACRTGR